MPHAIKIPDDVVVVVCLHVWQPPDLTHFTVTVCPSGLVVVVGLQSGRFGSALVHSQVTVAETPPPPAIRAVTKWRVPSAAGVREL